ALAGNRADDADVRAADRVGNRLGQGRDAFRLDPRAELDLVPGDRRTAAEAGDLGVQLEFGENMLYRPDDLVVGLGPGLADRAGRQQVRRWQGVRAFGCRQRQLLGPGRAGRRLRLGLARFRR